MRCVGCWFYIDFWVGITDKSYWQSVKNPVMHIGSPFRLNKHISRHSSDNILAYLSYTNREVQYEDGLLHMRQMEEA